MTFRQAQKLKPRRSFVLFAGAKFRFIRLEKMAGVWFVVIEDERNHYDKLLMSSCAVVERIKEKV